MQTSRDEAHHSQTTILLIVSLFRTQMKNTHRRHAAYADNKGQLKITIFKTPRRQDSFLQRDGIVRRQKMSSFQRSCIVEITPKR